MAAQQPPPEKSLLLADRLYGTPALIWKLQPQLMENGSETLMRVKSNLKVNRIEQLSDGSRLVCVPVVDPKTQ